MDRFEWPDDVTGPRSSSRRPTDLGDAVLEAVEQAEKRGLIERTSDRLKDSGVNLRGRSGTGGIEAMKAGAGDASEYLRGYPGRVGNTYGQWWEDALKRVGIEPSRSEGRGSHDARLDDTYNRLGLTPNGVTGMRVADHAGDFGHGVAPNAPVPAPAPRGPVPAGPPAVGPQATNASLSGATAPVQPAAASATPAAAQGGGQSQLAMVDLARQMLGQGGGATGGGAAPAQSGDTPFYKNPDFQAALLQAGIAMMANSGQGLSFGESLGRAAGSGASAVAANRKSRQTKAEKARAEKFARDKIILDATLEDRKAARQASTRAGDLRHRRDAEAGKDRRHKENMDNRLLETLMDPSVGEFGDKVPGRSPQAALRELDILRGRKPRGGGNVTAKTAPDGKQYAKVGGQVYEVLALPKDEGEREKDQLYATPDGVQIWDGKKLRQPNSG